MAEVFMLVCFTSFLGVLLSLLIELVANLLPFPRAFFHRLAYLQAWMGLSALFSLLLMLLGAGLGL